MILKEICTCSETGMHHSHLINRIGNLQCSSEELEGIIKTAYHQAIASHEAVLISLAGHFDLLVTESRIHVILITNSYDIPDEIKDKPRLW